MKFIARQILIVFFLIAIPSESQSKQRLSNLYKKLELSKGGHYEKVKAELAKTFDLTCVENFFRLPKNQKMIVNELEERILMTSAVLKCADIGTEFKDIFKDPKDFYPDVYIDCLKGKLMKLNSTSRFLEGMEVTDNYDFKECEDFFRTEHNRYYRYEMILGPLDSFTCGAIENVNDYLKVVTEFELSMHGKWSKDVRLFEMEKLKDYAQRVAFTTVDCLLKRFEDDPEEFLKNDTLSYFLDHPIPYNPQFAHMKVKFNDEYTKKLERFKDSFDYDCVREKVNLPQNGAITLLEIEARIIIASAMSKCIKYEFLEFSEIFFNLEVSANARTEESIACANFKVENPEAPSKLESNSVNNSDDINACNVYFEFLDDPLYKYESSVNKLNESSCGTLTKIDVDAIKYKIILLASDEDQESKYKNIKILFENAVEKLHEFADCVLKSVK